MHVCLVRGHIYDRLSLNGYLNKLLTFQYVPPKPVSIEKYIKTSIHSNAVGKKYLLQKQASKIKFLNITYQLLLLDSKTTN